MVVTSPNHHLELVEYLLQQTAGLQLMHWKVTTIGGGINRWEWSHWSEKTLAGMLVLLVRYDLLSMELIENQYQKSEPDLVELVKNLIEQSRHKSARSHQ